MEGRLMLQLRLDIFVGAVIFHDPALDPIGLLEIGRALATLVFKLQLF